MTRILAALVMAGLLVAADSPAVPAIDEAVMASHIRTLASDEFEGRAPGTAGEHKTIAFLIDAFTRAGLEPGGDLRADGTRAWTQRVPMFEAKFTSPLQISVKTPAGRAAWTQGEEMVARASLTGTKRLEIENAPLIFVGYGVSAPERDWDDFKGVDLKGKIAVALVNDPDFESGEGDFGGKAMTYYGRWTYKYQEAAKRGALGMIIIHEDRAASYGWKTVSNSSMVPLFDIARPDPAAVHPELEGWIREQNVSSLFSAAEQDYAKLKALATTRDFRPIELQGVTLSLSGEIKTDAIETNNVIGLLKGKKRPTETILFGAHWDHLGIGPPDTTGDTIYNGAIDNAPGVAALIEIARVLAAMPRADRSLVFAAWTNEERGILGSEYYATFPPFALETTVGNITIDGMFPMGLARDFSTFGYANSTLNDMLIAEGALSGRRYSPDARPEAGLPYRSDHFPLAKRGVPALLFASGEDLVNGGKAAGHAYVNDYFANRYHQPSDEYEADWDLSGITADANLLAAFGRRLATSTAWPIWSEDSEFHAERAKSDSLRR